MNVQLIFCSLRKKEIILILMHRLKTFIYILTLYYQNVFEIFPQNNFKNRINNEISFLKTAYLSYSCLALIIYSHASENRYHIG